MAGFDVEVDPAHGARWTSLVDPHGREWLWSRPDPARVGVNPGNAFVDVGGVEECFPTIGGAPDHGDVWSRPWRADGEWLVVETGASRLARRLDSGDSAVAVDYRLEAEPGTRFIWAMHAALRPTEGARIIAPEGRPARAWPGHVRPVETSWPRVLGIEQYDTLAPDDGSAMFCVLPGLEELSVRSGESGLRLRMWCPDQPVSFGIWRNLGGYPWDGKATYRNFVVEPMLGRAVALAAAGPDDAAVVPTGGVVEWRVVLDQPDMSTGGT